MTYSSPMDFDYKYKKNYYITIIKDRRICYILYIIWFWFNAIFNILQLYHCDSFKFIQM